MKKQIFLSVLSSFVLFLGCAGKKDPASEKSSKTAFYGTNWELEYISGPRIAFDGLYPETRPSITFTEATSQFSGDSSCNAYSGKFTKTENEIHFGDAIKTMRFCEGGGESTFMNMLGKINKFTIDSDGKLVLLKDDIPMMRFRKTTKQQH